MKMSKLKTLLLALSVISIAGCVTPDGAGDFTNINLYQPPTLSLSAGTVIQTKEGIYTVQLDETWHSDKRYRDIERKLFTLTTLKPKKSSTQRVKIGLAHRQ